MEQATLENYISQGLSTYEIAKAENCSQTNVRHWLRKFGLNTKPRKDQFKLKASTSTSTNPNSYLKQKERAKLRKLEVIRLKGGECSKCGYKKNSAALEFHHRDPSNKTFTLDARKLSNTNWTSILAELEKCDLLCANCHAETHCPDSEIDFSAPNKIDHLNEKMQNYPRKKEKEPAKPRVLKGNWPTPEEMSKIIWEIPASKLKERFNVSDSAIGKFCRKHNIAKPPRGYWTKKQVVP